MRTLMLTFALTANLSAAVLADPSHHGYRDAVSRAVKGLSDAQMADLKAGRGMGLSLPAELQGYPGPKHVLELSDQLNLTDAQRSVTEALVQQMTAEAVALGAQLIEAEKALDFLFASGSATPETVRAQAAKIATLQGELRFTHLKYHLSVTQTLTLEQRQRYVELRGYAGTKFGQAPAHMHQAQHSQHHGSSAGHHAAAKPPVNEAAAAYKAANDKMHKDMTMEFTGDADVDLLRGMIPHHRGAIDMARVALKYGKDAEVRKMAEDIIKAQEQEIAQMEAMLARLKK